MSQPSQKPRAGDATAHAELQWALSSQSANVLVIGAGETAVGAVQAYLTAPLTVIQDGVPPDFAGTCLVANAWLLTRDQQQALVRRLDRRSDLRLVTLSAVPLYPLVQSGAFAETLYYRLNTITVEWPADGRDDSPSRPA